jgi:hypothetical protein
MKLADAGNLAVSGPDSVPGEPLPIVGGHQFPLLQDGGQQRSHSLSFTLKGLSGQMKQGSRVISIGRF